MEAGRLSLWARWEVDSSAIGDGEERRNTKELRNTRTVWLLGEKCFDLGKLKRSILIGKHSQIHQLCRFKY